MYQQSKRQLHQQHLTSRFIPTSKSSNNSYKKNQDKTLGGGGIGRLAANHGHPLEGTLWFFLNVSRFFEFVQFYFLTCWSSLLLGYSSCSLPYKRMKPTKRYRTVPFGPWKSEKERSFERQVLSVGERRKTSPLATIITFTTPMPSHSLLYGCGRTCATCRQIRIFILPF